MIQTCVRPLAWGLFGIALACGCQPAAPQVARATVELQIEPDPPRVGDAAVALLLTDPAGQPLEGGTLKVEGNMNHAGMKPVFADLTETEPGRYEGTLDLTMAGDWFLLVTGKLSDGRQVNEKVDLPGVERP